MNFLPFDENNQILMYNKQYLSLNFKAHGLFYTLYVIMHLAKCQLRKVLLHDNLFATTIKLVEIFIFNISCTFRKLYC